MYSEHFLLVNKEEYVMRKTAIAFGCLVFVLQAQAQSGWGEPAQAEIHAETPKEKEILPSVDSIFHPLPSVHRGGFERAINRVLAEEQRRATRDFSQERSSTDGPLLASRRFFDCEKEMLSLDAWLLSDHKGSKKDHNEKNRGFGLVYSCDGWSVAFDRMINSNRGQAQVLSLVWGTELLRLGPVFINGSIGYARLSYEVPRYRVTLYENTVVGFVGVGLTSFPKLTVNIAPVPETAGKAIIVWVKYEIHRFK